LYPMFKLTACENEGVAESGNAVKQGKSVIWLFLKINLSRSMSINRYRRELSIDMVFHNGISKQKKKYALPLFYLHTYTVKTKSLNFQIRWLEFLFTSR